MKHLVLQKYISFFKAPIRHRDASVQVKDDWAVVEDMDFPRLTKLSLPTLDEPEDLLVFWFLFQQFYFICIMIKINLLSPRHSSKIAELV